MPLASLSTSSNRISTAAWKRPGTPGVALRAASQSRKQQRAPSKAEISTESKLTTEKSTRPFGLPVPRWVRWWMMYSPGVWVCSAAAAAMGLVVCRSVFGLLLCPAAPEQREGIGLQADHEGHEHHRPVQAGDDARGQHQ